MLLVPFALNVRSATPYAPRGSAAVKEPTPFGVATLPYRCVGVPSAASRSFGLAV